MSHIDQTIDREPFWSLRSLTSRKYLPLKPVVHPPWLRCPSEAATRLCCEPQPPLQSHRHLRSQTFWRPLRSVQYYGGHTKYTVVVVRWLHHWTGPPGTDSTPEPLFEMSAHILITQLQRDTKWQQKDAKSHKLTQKRLQSRTHFFLWFTRYYNKCLGCATYVISRWQVEDNLRVEISCLHFFNFL